MTILTIAQILFFMFNDKGKGMSNVVNALVLTSLLKLNISRPRRYKNAIPAEELLAWVRLSELLRGNQYIEQYLSL